MVEISVFTRKLDISRQSPAAFPEFSFKEEKNARANLNALTLTLWHARELKKRPRRGRLMKCITEYRGG
jgi:hypothetical protein